MRRKLFLVERVSTRENPAGLNTKPLSRERREFLMKKNGLVSANFNTDETYGNGNNTKMKAMVRDDPIDPQDKLLHGDRGDPGDTERGREGDGSMDY